MSKFIIAPSSKEVNFLLFVANIKALPEVAFFKQVPEINLCFKEANCKSTTLFIQCYPQKM